MVFILYPVIHRVYYPFIYIYIKELTTMSTNGVVNMLN